MPRRARSVVARCSLLAVVSTVLWLVIHRHAETPRPASSLGAPRAGSNPSDAIASAPLPPTSRTVAPHLARLSPKKQVSGGTPWRVGVPDDTDAASNQLVDTFYQQRAYPLGYIPGGARMQAIRQLDQMLDDRQFVVRRSPDRRDAAATGSAAQQWIQIGPQPTTYAGTYSLPAPGYLTSGRVTALAVDPGNSRVVYLGAPKGESGRPQMAAQPGFHSPTVSLLFRLAQSHSTLRIPIPYTSALAKNTVCLSLAATTARGF